MKLVDACFGCHSAGPIKHPNGNSTEHVSKLLPLLWIGALTNNNMTQIFRGFDHEKKHSKVICFTLNCENSPVVE